MKKKDMLFFGAGIQYYATSDPKSRNHRNTAKGELWKRKSFKAIWKKSF